MSQNKTVRWFRYIAIAEGISFLVLLLIAMPLKYFAGLPEAVKLVGWAHGILFVAFLVLAYEVKSVLNKKMSWYATAFLAAILPFGTIILDKNMRRNGDFQ